MSKKPPIVGPVDDDHGFKVYVVNGHNFLVPPHYKLHKPVGFGAYGIVCSAVDGRSNHKVAIKKCQNVFKDTGDCKRIYREVRLQKFLRHENLLGIRSVYVGGPREEFQDVYIVSDLLDTDLNTVIRSRQTMSEEHVKYFIYQILRGLKFLHSASVMHRDLKPANLLVNVNCDLRLCDYGLARRFDQTNDGPFTDYVVTRWYRPPELLLMNTSYSQSVDIWSVGCIFVELVNRRPLFMGKDYLAQLSLICETLGTPAKENLEHIQNKEAVKYMMAMPSKASKTWKDIAPSLSGAGADFLSHMLQFEPTQRWTADQLMAHPFMASLHDPRDEPSSEQTFEWDQSMEALSKDELRNLFWEEAQLYPDSATLTM